ncbi:MAG: type II restriction endonuclease [DPANN group archaeon]|nr:type II restriction endonuclease [DPANN group archaeon]
MLNVLIGKNDIEKEFINLIREYPKVRNVLPILIAIRNNKLNDLEIISDIETLTSENKKILFEPHTILTPQNEKDLISFFRHSGLKTILMDKSVKNLVDYCFGIEVGMDTNGRKNRTGTLMENLIEVQIKKFCSGNGVEYITQATQISIKHKWGIGIESDKTSRRYDFAIFNKKTGKLFLVETNFYGGGGSKRKSTAGEYKGLYDFVSGQGVDLIWVTDGIGWNTAIRPLFETFEKNDFVFNLELIKKGILKDVIC